MLKCSHPACNCHTADAYCSTHCEDAGDSLELACDCGHPGCQELMAPEPDPVPEMPLPPLI